MTERFRIGRGAVSVALVAMLLVLLQGCASSSAGDSAEDQVTYRVPDLSGDWEVDYALSESADDKLRYLYEVTRSHLAQRIRQDERPGAALAAMAELQGLIDLGRLADFITRPGVMKIEQSGSDIVVEREGDYALVCDFLSQKVTGNQLGFERCGWHNGQLVFEVALPDGLFVVHRLVLADNGKRLSVATTVASEDVNQPFTVNRVFMPYEAGQGQFNCVQTVASGKTCTLLGTPAESTE